MRGRGSPSRQEGGWFFIENGRRWGGRCGRAFAGKFGGVGAKYFFRGRNSHKVVKFHSVWQSWAMHYEHSVLANLAFFEHFCTGKTAFL